VTYEPPPDPREWLGNDVPPRQVSESPDTRETAPERHEEPLTWRTLIAYRDAYRARHGVPAHY